MTQKDDGTKRLIFLNQKNPSDKERFLQIKKMLFISPHQGWTWHLFRKIGVVAGSIQPNKIGSGPIPYTALLIKLLFYCY